MKQLIINSIELVQFQKFDYKKVSFNKDITEVSGDNGTGKTTIYSGVTWLLFGKDSQGREKFDIKHLVGGVKQDHVSVEVSGEFTLITDGARKVFKLRRVLVEKWDDKTDTYKGDETRCYVDNVPMLVSEYNEYINNIIREEDFRILTSVTYFLGLKMEEQREYLCRMAGTKEIADVVHGNLEWEEIIAKMPQGVSIDDYTKTVKEALKRYKDDKKSIQPSINALTQSMPEELNWEEIKLEADEAKAEIDRLNQAISSEEDALKAQFDARTVVINNLMAKKEELMKLNADERTDLLSIREAAEREVRILNHEYDETAEKVKRLQRQLEGHNHIIMAGNARIKALDLETTELQNRYIAERDKKFENTERLMCPLATHISCGTQESLALYNEKREKLREEFNTKQVAMLESIIAQGKAKMAELNAEKSRVAQVEQQKATDMALFEQAQTALAGMTKVTTIDKSADEAEIKNHYIARREAVQKEIDELNASITNAPTKNAVELKQSRDTAMAKFEQLTYKLAGQQQIKNLQAQIEGIREKGKEIARQITCHENLLEQLLLIKRAVIEDATNRINEMFQITHWVTSIQQKNGDWKDVCIPTVDGVSISMNAALRINVGLDICYAISRFIGISVPCFIDGREAVNEIVNLGNTQIINLRVAPKGTPLSIH